jgi:hypothetical protein
MRAFRVEIIAGAALLLAALPVRAQNGAPTLLVPPIPAPSAAQSAPPSDAGGATAPSGDDIQTVPLAPIDPAWIGTLGPADGALPHDMWQGTDRDFVVAALPLLQPTNSPALQDLGRRLLLSDALAPASPSRDQTEGPSLPELRVDRLLALGRIDGAPLLDVLPQTNASEDFDRDSVELRVAANDLDGACRTVQSLVARYQNAWWDRAVVACQALNGAFDQAALGLAAMREQKTGRDPAFEALIDAIDGHRAKLDKLPDPTPLRVTLVAAAKLPLPPDALAAAGPAALAVWAANDKVPISQRLAAAEKAEALGALPPEALGLLYAGVTPMSGEEATALKNGKLADEARGRAILYGIARTGNPQAQRITALNALLADARRHNAFVPMARVIAPILVDLQPSPSLQAFAGDAARVLLVAGNIDAAAPWLDLAQAKELQLVADLARAAPADDIAGLITDVASKLAARDAAAAPHQTDLLAALFGALGQSPGDIDWTDRLRATQQTVLPPAALWLDQEQAAQAGRVGETVLASLVIAANGDRLSTEPVVLARVVSGLKAVGLEADARRIAVEAALAAGI